MFDLAQKLLSLSKEMLFHAQNKDWHQLSQTQAKRAHIVRQLETFEMDRLNQTDSLEMGKLLAESRKLEKRCVQLAETERKGLTAEHTKVSKGKAMQKAYGATGNRR